MVDSDVMRRAVQCLVVLPGPRPLPVPCWFDDASLWLADRFGQLGEALATGDPVTAWIPPPRPGDPAVVLAGTARRFGRQDPRGLVLHAPALLGAMAAVELAVPPPLPELTRVLRRGPVRVTVQRSSAHDVPAPPAGMGPPLPPAVPAEVRRALGAGLAVVAVSEGSGGLDVVASTWDARMAVKGWADRPAGTPAAVALLAPDRRLTGMALLGETGPGGTLRPHTVQWWSGTETSSAPAMGTRLVLPD